jgi:hypothetical protein
LSGQHNRNAYQRRMLSIIYTHNLSLSPETERKKKEEEEEENQQPSIFCFSLYSSDFIPFPHCVIHAQKFLPANLARRC